MKNIVLILAAAGLCSVAASLPAADFKAEELRTGPFGAFAMQGGNEFPMPAAANSHAVFQAPLDLRGIFGRLTRLFPVARHWQGETVLYSVPLNPLANLYLKPDTAFTTGKGTKVYVSGNEAVNCPDGGSACKGREKSFVILTTDKGATFFVRGMEIAYLPPLYNGSKAVVIDGGKYTLRLYVDTSVPGNSRLDIKGPSGLAFTGSLQKLGDAAAMKGVDAALSKTYKLAYGNELKQGPGGAGFTETMLVYMIAYPVNGSINYFAFNPQELAPGGSSFPSFEPAYGFRLNAGALEIYKF
ncbi:MAG: hypothetical protein WCW52_07750 [Elusimicrobiales bacterium]|jgi:hypothetical protein